MRSQPNQPNLPDFQPYGQKPCSTEIAGKPKVHQVFGHNIIESRMAAAGDDGLTVVFLSRVIRFGVDSKGKPFRTVGDWWESGRCSPVPKEIQRAHGVLQGGAR